MPKEILVSESVPDENDAILVELSWGRDDETVQIATTLVYKDGYVIGDRKKLEVVEGDARWELEGGWFATLNRSQINTLIRNLRRARDQAFGRDE